MAEFESPVPPIETLPQQPIDQQPHAEKPKKAIIIGDPNELPELKLSEAEEKKLLGYCLPLLKEEVDYHDSTVVPELERYEKIYQMKVKAKTWPWKGCSNIASSVATRAVDAIESRGQKVIWESGEVIATDAPIWATPEEKALIPKIESFLDDTLRITLKAKPVIRDIWHNASIHRSCVGKLRWVNNVEQVRDIEEYTDVESFQEEFATAKEAAISEEQYQQYIADLSMGIPVTIRSRYKDVTKQPILEIVLRKDYIRPHETPAYTKPEWEAQRMTGLSWNEIEAKVEAGIYSKKAIEKIKEKVDPNWKLTEEKEFDPKEKSYRTHKYTFYECIWKYKLKKKDMAEKFIFTFDIENEVLVQAEYFPYFHNQSYFIPFRIMKSLGWDGVSVPEKMEHIIKQDQDLRNIAIDSSTIDIMPITKARIGADVDMDSFEYYPAAIWWCKEPEKDVQELYRAPKSQNLRSDIEKLEMEAEMIIGVTANTSGRETGGDKNAPAKKTLALINESNIQINDYKDVFQEGMAELAYQLLMLYYQFSEDAKEYIGGYKLNRAELKRKHNSFKLRGNSVAANKDLKRQDAIFKYNLLRKDPVIANRPQSVKKLIESVLISFDDDPAGILPTDEQLQQEQVEVQKKAIQQMIMQQQQKMAQRPLASGGIAPASPPMSAPPSMPSAGGMPNG